MTVIRVAGEILAGVVRAGIIEMSYCRFSSDDFQCDLYCYQSVYSGYVTHVAANKLIFEKCLPPPVSMNDTDQWMARKDQIDQMIKDSIRVPVGLPEDGKTFVDETPQEFLVRLLELKKMGYRFPDNVLTIVKEEIEGDSNVSE